MLIDAAETSFCPDLPLSEDKVIVSAVCERSYLQLSLALQVCEKGLVNKEGSIQLACIWLEMASNSIQHEL